MDILKNRFGWKPSEIFEYKTIKRGIILIILPLVITIAGNIITISGESLLVHAIDLFYPGGDPDTIRRIELSVNKYDDYEIKKAGVEALRELSRNKAVREFNEETVSNAYKAELFPDNSYTHIK